MLSRESCRVLDGEPCRVFGREPCRVLIREACRVLGRVFGGILLENNHNEPREPRESQGVKSQG